MTGRTWAALAAMLAVVALATTTMAAMASATAEVDWTAKVDQAVLDAAAGGSTEFFVYLHRTADLSGAAELETKAAKGRYVYEQLTDAAADSQAPVVATLEQHGATHRSFWITNAIVARGGLSAVEAVARMPGVDHVYAVAQGGLERPAVELDPPGGTTSASLATTVFDSIALVNADDVWSLGYRGQGVTVAGADTGVRWTHEALKTRYRGWDGSAATHDYNWHDSIHVSNPANVCPADSPDPCDDDTIIGGGHGTHTVGTMVGSGPERPGQKNEIGMAPDANWIACRNMQQGVGAIPTYLECMQWFIAPTRRDGSAPDPTKAPDVVNNSWGCVEVCPPPALQDVLRASRAAGIFYAVSAGNDGGVGVRGICNTIYHPLARYPEAFTVGSTTWTTDTVSSFSSRGPVLLGDPPNHVLLTKPNITAPGSAIRSALRANDSAYGSLSGTSMAGPHVAGLVALIISANPALRGHVDRIEDIIEQTAVRKTTTEGCGLDTTTTIPNNTYGWGRINALAAVQLAENKPPVAGDDSATVEQGQSVTVNVLANDSDPDGDSLTVASHTHGAHGTVTQNADGTLTYTHDGSNTSSDSFEYTVSDGQKSDTATVAISVTPRPDLRVTSVQVVGKRRNGEIREGDKVTIRATVANTGAASAGASRTEFLLDGTTVLGVVDTGAVAAGSSRTVSVSWNTRRAGGTHEVTATADRTGQVAEASEQNNSTSTSVTVASNRVRNGDFEADEDDDDRPDGWSDSNTGAGSASYGGGGTDGSQAASTSGNGGSAAIAGSPTWTSAPIAVSAGDVLDFQASVLAGTTSAPGAGLVYLGALGNVVGTATLVTAPVLTGGFVTLERGVTIPAGVTQVRVVLTGFSATDLATGGTATFDDVGLFAR